MYRFIKSKDKKYFYHFIEEIKGEFIIINAGTLFYKIIKAIKLLKKPSSLMAMKKPQMNLKQIECCSITSLDVERSF